jgi:mono/diheme cytochrome c family protein
MPFRLFALAAGGGAAAFAMWTIMAAPVPGAEKPVRPDRSEIGKAASATFAEDVKPFLEAHCVRCHSEKKPKGDLRLDALERDFGKPSVAGRWMEIMGRINSGEMPPKKSPRPKPEDVARVSEWITAQLTEAEAAAQATAGQKVSFHRLTREEYRNTIRDLLGVTYDAADPTGLPEDPDWQGFERIGSVLTLSPAHVEKYLAAAETVLNESLALGPQPKREVIRWTAANIRVRSDFREELTKQGRIDQVRADIVPNNNLDGHGNAAELLVPATGDYQVRVKLSGLRPEGGRAPRLLVLSVTCDRVLFEQDVEAPEDKPITLQFRAHLPAGVHQIRVVNAVPGPNPQGRYSRPLSTKPFFNMKGRQPWQLKLTDDDYKPIWPVILLDWMEWEGPMQESWPTPAHQLIFFGGEKATKDLAYAREIISRFAARAYRRLVQPAEVERLLELVQNSQKLGDNFEASVKTALLAVLCSKSFLFLVEGSAAAPSPRLNDWELASRLSYFLWSTMPDERLFDLAREGKLHQPDVLRTEVRRLMTDPKARAFADSFPRQWLQLRRVGMFAPDRKIYPDYDDYLEKSMVAETTTFFREVLERNLSLREFLDSDWTMLNERLAGHYGIKGVKGESLQHVTLKPEDHRGGLLTQASILSLTSDGTRHRPVHRGKWVLESLYGKPPPPPPPNVGDIKPTPPNQPKTSLRAKLEAHRNDANCAACHRKIDPLGLAFDNYDAIGRWRTEEAVRDGAGEDPKIDARGELPDGRTFADAAGLKKLMIADVDKFADAFGEKLATYALRRRMTFADRAELKRLAEQSKTDDYRLASFVESLVRSDLFQKR